MNIFHLKRMSADLCFYCLEVQSGYSFKRTGLYSDPYPIVLLLYYQMEATLDLEHYRPLQLEIFSFRSSLSDERSLKSSIYMSPDLLV